MINRGTCDRLEDAIDNFEETWSLQSRSKIEDLLCEFGLVDDHEAIAELVRIDIELRYERGLSIELNDYLNRFTILRECPERVAQIAFEDYRSRSAFGHPVPATRWSGLPGIHREEWYQELSGGPSSSARPTKRGASQIAPAADPAFEAALEESGFHLVQQIGEGAFSRVYLANQYALADRFVVLKVVTESLAEPERMAQLQHTNIVPIYSFHRILSRSVICMPYAGCVTLHNFLQVKGDVSSRGGASLITTVKAKINETKVAVADPSSHAEVMELSPSTPAADDGAVLRPLEAFSSYDCTELASWIFQRLAGALAHAHARGVLHNDLKPSNVLIRNDGEPALLDFNLSQSLGKATPRHVGGTLPYMSPETYRAMMGSDVQPHAASDLYGLGVMLFEFVTGRLPYPTPKSIAPIDLGPAIELRKAEPDWRPEDSVTPGLKAIIDRCLCFAAQDRYGSADELQSDLRREEQNLALAHTGEPVQWRIRKWVRRHPRAISSGLVATLLLAILVPMTYKAVTWKRDFRALASQADRETFSDESAEFLSALMVDPDRQKDANIRSGMRILEQHGLLGREGIDRLLSSGSVEEKTAAREAVFRHLAHLGILEVRHLGKLRLSDPVASRDFGRLDQLIAAAKLVDEGEPSRSRLFLESERARLSGNEQRYQMLQKAADAVLAESDSELYLEAVRLLANYDSVGASELLTALADRNSVPSALRWTMLGRAQFADKKYEDAKLSYTQAIERAPESAKLRVLRGRCHLDLRQGDAAIRDFLKAIELDPDSRSAWSQLGLIYHQRREFDEALKCYNRSLSLAPGRIWTLLKRSLTYRAMGKKDLADSDFKAAMAAEYEDHNDLIYRAFARTEEEPEAALADLRKAHQLNPDRPAIEQEIARILAVELGRHEEAIEVYGKVIMLQPENEFALMGRALSYVRIGKIREALADTKAAMKEPNSGTTIYQAACVHALVGRQPNQRRAAELLVESVESGYRPKRLMSDPDLESIRETDEFRAVKRFMEMAKGGNLVTARSGSDDENPSF
jgi:serine/threonine protein kinase/tetratricopeptide (TPR) repeat protein